MADAYLFVKGSNRVAPSRSLNSIATVAQVESPTTFTVNGADGAGFLSGAEVEVFRAAPGVFAGPFVWDSKEGVSITGTNSILSTSISKSTQLTTLNVVDATKFPDSEGWLVIGFGTEYQTGPIRYLGRNSSTKLNVDYTFVFPLALPAGLKVNLLGGRIPFSPTRTDTGTFWLTASNSGRVSAQSTVDEIVAAGVDMDISVAYPGDRGLGGEGRPDGGTQKLSDKVAVWGGDNLDEEIEKARNE